MNLKVAKELKKKNAKLLVIDSEMEQRIKKLCEVLDTNAIDVVSTATKLLEKSINKKILIRDEESKTEVEIDIFQNLNNNYTGSNVKP